MFDARHNPCYSQENTISDMKKFLFIILLAGALSGWNNNSKPVFPKESPASFEEIGSIDIGGQGAAEITAFDPFTRRLFVVNNTGPNKIDVLDFSNPASMRVIADINISSLGLVNSLAVSEGKLAAAVEAQNKQDNGRVIIYDTKSLAEIKQIMVGALPDMICYSADGNFIVTANEGEPSVDYTNDPLGTVSIISVRDNYSVKTLDFNAYNKLAYALKEKGLRIFGPGASVAQDLEPEYITVSPDSKTAWVTLQENNAIARINLQSKTITGIFPLGYKDFSQGTNGIDPSDADGIEELRAVKTYGMYQPDAIANLEIKGIPYLFTVNEGDPREYEAFVESKRVGAIDFDKVVFQDAPVLKEKANLGRLNVTTSQGDTDGDGDYDELYSFGARSFSVWNGNTGELLFDSKNELEKKIIAAGIYDDKRSDDKGVEPEGIALGNVGNKIIAFVGLERVDAVALYDVTNPGNPQFLQILKTGDAPEGILFIPALQSPTGKSLLVVSSEGDGVIKVFSPQSL